MRYRILPYRQGSKGARALAVALGGKVLKLEGSSFAPQAGDVIINWGNVNGLHTVIQPFPDIIDGYFEVHNNAAKIKEASNKLLFFRKMKAAGLTITPEFWETQDDIPDEAFPVVCRTVLAGHSGDGIVIAGARDDLVPASLYVKYVKKQEEYRIHVGRRDENFAIIAEQRKARRQDHANPNWQIRNHVNGFIFARGGFSTPTAVTEAAIAGLRASGLDFGAVDVIWNQEKQRAYVLEINTAPGLEGQTVADYAAFFEGGG